MSSQNIVPKKQSKKKPEKEIEKEPIKEDPYSMSKEVISESETPGFIVGIGTSAGGLEALEQFFDSMPANSGMGFVVIQHLSPTHKSLMDELLSKRTKMKVHKVENGMAIQPNSIYLIPPKNNMIIFQGKLLLTEQDMRTHGLNLPIDIFLKSLAEDQGEKAISIILTGTGSDGTRGIRDIKEAGGLVMVQDPESAKFDGMPKSAIATGLVDFITSPDKMPQRLLQYINHPHVASAGQDNEFFVDENRLTRIASLVKNQTGLDLSKYKPNTIIRRIERRMSVNQFNELKDYLHYLEESPEEVNFLFKEVLIGVTSFFRDNDAFEILAKSVIPEILGNARKDRKIRVWVAGCSTGEEAYSLAILFDEAIRRESIDYDIKIFATDIDRDAIVFAGNGIYSESIAMDISPKRLSAYFNKRENDYQVKRFLREMVIFANHNIIKDPPFTRIDLITCRNLLIYMQPALQRKVLALFSFSLKTGGYLFLGTSESLGDAADQFKTIETKSKIFQNQGGVRPPLSEVLQMPSFEAKEKPGPVLTGKRSFDGSVLDSVTHAVFNEILSPAVVVDDKNMVVHILGDPGEFLAFRTGVPSFELSKIVHKDLAMPVEGAVHQAGKKQKEVRYQKVRFTLDGESKFVNIHVLPLRKEQGKGNHFIIFFEHPPTTAGNEEDLVSLSMDEAASQRINDLEQELKYTKENLQATIEELETSNEELQATNEELLASNEELQSTNEELQSVNEELYTVNAQYQSKIQELSELNDDFDNLLESTPVGTLFLDENFHIRKFTPEITRFISLREEDIGRPIYDFSHRLKYDNLFEDAREVARNGDSLEREVETIGQGVILLRIVPFVSKETNNSKGVVITFIDVSNNRSALNELRDSKEQLSFVLSISHTSPEDWNLESTDTQISTSWQSLAKHSINPVFGVAPGGKIAAWSERAADLLGYDVGEAEGKDFSILFPENERNLADEIIEEFMEEPDRFKKKGTVLRRRNGEEINCSLLVKAVHNSDNNSVGALIEIINTGIGERTNERVHKDS